MEIILIYPLFICLSLVIGFFEDKSTEKCIFVLT